VVLEFSQILLDQHFLDLAAVRVGTLTMRLRVSVAPVAAETGLPMELLALRAHQIRAAVVAAVAAQQEATTAAQALSSSVTLTRSKTC
jgi:hypothetical protein